MNLNQLFEQVLRENEISEYVRKQLENSSIDDIEEITAKIMRKYNLSAEEADKIVMSTSFDNSKVCSY
jgi:tartrate dehydratase alpha subunit/fumarate hydratase class I-like protein